MKKKIAVIALALAMMLVMFAGCDGSPTQNNAATEKPAATETPATETPAAEAPAPAASGAWVGDSSEVYYMNAFLSGHPFWVGCLRGAEAAAKQLGVTVKYQGDPEYDVNKAVDAFNQIVALKPAGIIVTCIDPAALVTPINDAMAAGVPVVTFDTDSPDSKRLSFVATDNQTLGVFLCDYMAENLTDGGKGVFGVVGRTDQLNIRQRMDGFADRAKDRYPDMTVIDFVDDKGELTVGTAAVSALLQAHPDINVIFAADGVGASASVQACKDAQRTDVKIMTVDSTADVLDLVKAGDLYGVVAQNNFNMGYWAMIELYAYVHSLDTPYGDWQQTGHTPLPPYINTGYDIVTAANADSFYME